MKKTFITLLFVIGNYFGFSQELKFTDVSRTHLPEVVLGTNNTMDMAVGDIDNDGDSDLVLAVEFYKNVILINDGTGVFTDGSNRLPDKQAIESPAPYKYYPYHDSEDVALADFDQDGDLDILIVTEDDQVNEYYLNDGKGFFTDHFSDLPTTGISNAVIAHDFDNDGWIDVMIGNNGQNVYLKNHEGEFQEETQERLPLREDITQDLEAFDFDQDGDLDVIVGNEEANYLLENDGSGTFKDVTEKYIAAEYQENGETREADFADINGDGLVDLYFANVTLFQGKVSTQRLLIWNKVLKKFVDKTNEGLGFTDDHSVVDADFRDLDLDGDLDLIYQTLEDPAIFLNNGKGKFEDYTERLIPGLTGMGIDVEVADFNRDGLPDIYFGNFRTQDYLLLQTK
jgi:hypothetical protein